MSPRTLRAGGGNRLDNWLRPHEAGATRTSALVAGQLVLLAGALVAYFGVRGVTKGAVDQAHANAYDILAFEESMGIDWEHSAQQFMLDHPTWITIWNSIYVYWYWPPLIGALVFLWIHDRRHFTILRDALIISGAIGLVIFAIYPVAPPRFIDGFTDTIAQSRRGMFISQPPGFVNKYAAIPSFHVGWLALAGMVVAARTPVRWQWLPYVPAIAMAGAVVFTGNHYIVDAVIGVAVCSAGLAIARRAHETATPTVLVPVHTAHGQPVVMAAGRRRA